LKEITPHLLRDAILKRGRRKCKFWILKIYVLHKKNILQI